MNLLAGDKKKDMALILGGGEEKEQESDKVAELGNIAFEAVKTGDKEKFSKALKAMIEICVINNKMED